MSDWDTFLERLAGEVCIRYVQCTGYPLPRVDEIHPDAIKTMTHVLRAKLLPLLEAGQAMRDFEDGVDWRKLCRNEDNCVECDHLRPLIETWTLPRQLR